MTLDPVGEILAARREETLNWGVGLAGTLAIHLGVFAAFIVASRLAPPHGFASPHAVTVRLVPVGKLSGGAPASVPRLAPAPSRPVIEKPREEPAPSSKALPLPEKNRKKTPEAPSRTAPRATAAPAAGMELPGPGVGAAGNPAGNSETFGASVSGFDSADFNYSYYAAQMLAAIGANWFKPTQQNASPVVYFKIKRDGTVVDVIVERSSGLPFVDRAAQRAVMAASPLPPLPAEFRDPLLGVHLKFE
jgi:protein TonB